MPLIGHTDNKRPCSEDVMFRRARYHIFTGRQRLKDGKISLGIITLYDALYSAMQWYVACPVHAKKLRSISTDSLNDDSCLFNILVQSGVIISGFDYGAFSELVDAALYKNVSGFNYTAILRDVESVMTELGIMPFEESEIPTVDSVISREF